MNLLWFSFQYQFKGICLGFHLCCTPCLATKAAAIV
jgi:hypothetical protein